MSDGDEAGEAMTVFLFRADGRLLVRTGGGTVHEATGDERRTVARTLWPFHLGMWRRWGTTG